MLHPLYFLLIYNRHKNGIKTGVSTVTQLINIIFDKLAHPYPDIIDKANIYIDVFFLYNMSI
ncbi:hypothetical protein C1142_04675 [Clostridium botulinum]|nr:hypothetical protein C1148_09865 [Clostridium botulinum]RUT58606.1 hypothetical protein C1142_04675 [Clostridium botulinum]RUT60547.1 hypothetical protein C1144_11825 [Clostridium botulinum]RUT61330.1 hypothetical protein C1143_11610 [Clostridium botulinum]